MSKLWVDIKKPKNAKFSQGFLFIDFKNAYDMVDGGKLLNKISKILDKSSTLYIFITFLLNNDFREIARNICNTSEGVPQGGVLNQILFNFFIYNLLEEFNKNNIINLAYPYDLAVLITAQNLDMVINIIENRSLTNNMIINKPQL